MPLSVFVVGTANFYNFMDGINGIAALTGFAAFGFLSIYAYMFDKSQNYTLLAGCISLACLGFLPYNFPSAKVFLGDVGSVLLGFLFAALVLEFSSGFEEIACLSGFLFPFYCDELTTMFIRIRASESLLTPHRKHLYQILVNEKRIPHWKVTLWYFSLQVFVSFVILITLPFGSFVVLSILMLFFLLFLLLSFELRRGSI